MTCLKFYKYRAAETLDRDLGIITDSQIFYSNPSQFNDPFDCAATSVSMDRNSRTLFIQKLLASQNPDIPEEWRTTLLEALDDDALSDSMVDRVLRSGYLEKHMTKYGILSLSSEIDNLLLWAHYASSHSGYAIEFDITQVVRRHKPSQTSYPDNYFEYNLMPSPVNYGRERPASISATNELTEPFYHKSDEWCYEKEYRVISNFGSGLKNFEPSLLASIYFGCKISEANKTKLINAVDKYVANTGNKVALYQASADDCKYELNFEPESTRA